MAEAVADRRGSLEDPIKTILAHPRSADEEKLHLAWDEGAPLSLDDIKTPGTEAANRLKTADLGPDIRDKLLALAADPEFARNACAALSGRDQHPVTQGLAKLIFDKNQDESVRQPALKALGKSGIKLLHQELVELAANKNESVSLRVEAGRALQESLTAEDIKLFNENFTDYLRAHSKGKFRRRSPIVSGIARLIPGRLKFGFDQRDRKKRSDLESGVIVSAVALEKSALKEAVALMKKVYEKAGEVPGEQVRITAIGGACAGSIASSYTQVPGARDFILDTFLKPRTLQFPGSSGTVSNVINTFFEGARDVKLIRRLRALIDKNSIHQPSRGSFGGFYLAFQRKGLVETLINLAQDPRLEDKLAEETKKIVDRSRISQRTALREESLA